MIKILSIAIAAFFILASSRGSQAQMGEVIFGNPDGSIIYACLDSDIEIGVWVSFNDDIGFIHIPLSSNDSVITSRNGGELYYPVSEWDDASFLPPNPDPYIQGYTNQSILGFYDLGGDPNPPLNPEGDTILIANYFMHTTEDTTHLYESICPFAEGFNPANGGLLIGTVYGTILPVPNQTFSCLFLVDYYPGDADNSGVVNGIDVIYLVNYFKGTNPPPDPYLGGDSNGDCWVNGPDITYLVRYLKGIGNPPFYGDCY